MSHQISETVQRYQLEIQQGSRRRVTQIVHDPLLPPSAPPRLETWESQKQPIGKGGQGNVFLQSCTSAGPRQNQCRALKVIRCQDGDRQRRYMREIEIMARFSDERLSNNAKFFVNMFGYYLSSSQKDICIAMEYCPKGDLFSYLGEHGALAETHTQDIVSQVLQGVGIMHQAGFAHRDIKPQNVLVYQCPSPDRPDPWWVKLADFGISKRVDTATATIQAGTLDYMAPELFEVFEAQTEVSEVIFKAADIWAVGAMAFFILTGQRGFKAWRRLSRDVDDCKPWPGSAAISRDGLEFILKTTDEIPTKRLGLECAWLEGRLASTVAVGRGESGHETSSSSASSRSSFSDDEAVTSLATRIPDTVLSEHSAEEPALRVPSSFKEAGSSVSLGQQAVAEDKEPQMSVMKPTPNESGGQLDVDMGSDLSLHKRRSKTSRTALAGPTDALAVVGVGGGYLAKELEAEMARVNIWDTPGQDTRAAAPMLSQSGNPRRRPASSDGYNSTPRHGSPSPSAAGSRQFEAVDGQDGAAVDPYSLTVVQIQGTQGRAMVNLASRKGDVDVLDHLISSGANITEPDSRDENWTTPLVRAARARHFEAVRLLAERGASVQLDLAKFSPIHEAAGRNDLAMVKLLLELGAKATDKDRARATAMHWAARAGSLEVLKHLLSTVDYGYLQHRDVGGLDAFEYATQRGQVDAMRLLLGSASRDDRADMVDSAKTRSEDVVQYLEDEMIAWHNSSPWPSSALVNKLGHQGRVQTSLHLQNFTNWMSKTNSLGAYKNAGRDLYSISKSAASHALGTVTPCVFLRHQSAVLAAGGRWRRTASLGRPHALGPPADIFSLSSPKRDRRDVTPMHVLHARAILGPRSDNIFFVYTLPPPPDGDGETATRQWVWQLTNKGTNDVARSFRLYVAEGPMSAITKGEVSPSPDLATLRISGSWNDSGAFQLHFNVELEPWEYLAAVITALMMWVRFIEGRLTVSAIRTETEEAWGGWEEEDRLSIT